MTTDHRPQTTEKAGLPEQWRGLTLVRNCVLVELPVETETGTRVQDSGLAVAVRNDILYAPTHGRVSLISDTVSKVNEGETVLFGKEYWQNAKEAAWGTDDERFKGLYEEQRVMALMTTDHRPRTTVSIPCPKGETSLCEHEEVAARYYMILPDDLLLGKVGAAGVFSPLNGYVLAEGIEKGTRDEGRGKEQEGLVIADLGVEQYQINTARVVDSGDNTWLSAGDTVQTLNHCDIPLEEELNCPLPYIKDLGTSGMPLFIIEGGDIISKSTDMDTGYKAGPKRLIILPEAQSEETAGGLVNTEVNKEKLQFATVHDSAVPYAQKGDRVVYARGAGMPLPELNGVAGLLVINEGDVFAVVGKENGQNSANALDGYEVILQEAEGRFKDFADDVEALTNTSYIYFKNEHNRHPTYDWQNQRYIWQIGEHILEMSKENQLHTLYRKKRIQEVRV